MSKNNKLIVLLSVLVILIIGCGILVWLINADTVATSEAVIESEKIPVNAELSGKPKDIFVKPNQIVSTGQLVAEIEVQQTVAAPAVSQKEMIESSKKKLEEAEENHTNFAIMYKDGIISQQEYDESLEKLASAKEDYENNVSGKIQPLSKTTVTTVTKKVYAPKDGTVSINFIDKGENAVKDNPIVLIDTDKPKLVAYFDTKFRENLSVGSAVIIKPNNFNGKVFGGIIESIAAEPEMSADKNSQVIPVTIRFNSNMNGYSFDKNQSFSVKLKK